ncbi:MAG: 1-acyl-sn-glycerol-3-phosphate acyltransferase [Gammaproteobacteria bacterium]|nr:1-acyl-sn-glycerol-3-phosphate acyltransferase [Gammaproteobacteria bacterium]
MLGTLRLVLRAFGLVLVCTWGVVLCLVALPLAIVPRWHQAVIMPISRHWCRLMCIGFGARVHEVGVPARGPVLVAANHVSWMDILVLGRRLGACFVSKSEVADWPVMGWLAKQGGTLFIHRGHRDSAERIAHAMVDRLQEGKRLMFFPEGTTSDGWQVLRFKHRLFVPAVETDTRVQPVTLCYELEEGGDPVAYIDGISFIDSIIGVMARHRTDVTIYWDDPLSTADRDRREIAAAAGQQVAARMAAHREANASDALEH